MMHGPLLAATPFHPLPQKKAGTFHVGWKLGLRRPCLNSKASLPPSCTLLTCRDSLLPHLFYPTTGRARTLQVRDSSGLRRVRHSSHGSWSHLPLQAMCTDTSRCRLHATKLAVIHDLYIEKHAITMLNLYAICRRRPFHNYWMPRKNECSPRMRACGRILKDFTMRFKLN
jgi:hypothetical protein